MWHKLANLGTILYMTGGKIFQILRLLLNITLSENQTNLKHTLDVKLNKNNVIANSKHGQKCHGLESTINRHREFYT